LEPTFQKILRFLSAMAGATDSRRPRPKVVGRLIESILQVL